MLYFIYAKEQMYEGLHGIYDYTLCDCDSEKEACEYGKEMSLQVISSYIQAEDEYYTQEDFIEEQGYDEWQDSYLDEYYERLNEIIDDYISYEIYSLKPGVTEEDYYKWEKENMPPTDFIDRFCDPI